MGNQSTLVCGFAVAFLVFGLASLSRAAPATKYETLDSRCESLNIAMCKQLPYNDTHFPNLLGHETQRQANLEIATFKPLIRLNCSPDLLQFLCSLYAPVCMPMAGTLHLLPPCRHHCKKVRKGCIKTLKAYGFKWPSAFKCNKFPKKKSNALCVDWSRKSRKSKKDLREKKKNKKTEVGEKTGQVASGSKNSLGVTKKNRKKKKNRRRKKNKGKKRKMKGKKMAKKLKRKAKKARGRSEGKNKLG